MTQIRIASGVPSLVALDLADFLAKELPPRDRLLGDWLLSQSLNMLYAQRGTGKTLVALWAGYAVASGGETFGWTAPEAQQTIYLDGEMPGSVMQERLRAVEAGSVTKAAKGMFRIVSPDFQDGPMPDLSTVPGQRAINTVIGNARLVIVDNISAWCRSGVENEAESWIPIADWALQLRRERRCVLFVHHAGKNGGQRGTSKREDLLDTSVMLRHPSDYRPQEGARFAWTWEKARHLYGDAAQGFEARLEPDSAGRMVWTTTGSDTGLGDRVRELKRLGMSANDIAAEVGKSRATVYRLLDKAA